MSVPRHDEYRGRPPVLPGGAPRRCSPAAAGREREVTVVTTIHPSAVLRADDDRVAVYAGLVADLRVAASGLSRPGRRVRAAGPGRW
ncbi:MAG TPA: hypothetical protein VGS62_04345 [Streptosporangiaceae bacterium]|nr:hypothetical protein [Streptosporangiaceae bacterium]